MRLVEAKKVECQHLHSWNYDPAKVVVGQSVQALPNGQHLCMDCGELFQPEIPERRYTLAQIEQLAVQWRNENEVTNDAQWVVSHLLAWLAKREQGRGATSGK